MARNFQDVLASLQVAGLLSAAQPMVKPEVPKPVSVQPLLSAAQPMVKPEVPAEPSRAVEYNNPGNVERNQDWAGMLDDTGYGTDNRFAIFDSPQMGLRALMRDVKTKIKDSDGNLREMINKYAPRSENPTEEYYKYVRAKVGSDQVKLSDLPDIVKAIIEFENKPGSALTRKYLNPRIFNEALSLSQINLPKGTSLADSRDRLMKMEEQ